MKQQLKLSKTKYFHLLFFIFAFFILYSRRTEVLLNPQFWGEDGAAWFANAYNFGVWKSLFLVQDGYFQTLSRIVAIVSLVFPIVLAPLIFNFSALIIQVLPASFFLSSRFDGLLPSFHSRFLIASFYLFLPNTAEIQGNITNVQWFLALLAFMILIASRSDRKSWKIFDLFFLILAGLSGPFSIFLLPIAFLLWFNQKQKQHLQNLSIVFATAMVQLFGIFFLDSGLRMTSIPEATIKLFFSIFGRQVAWGSLIGINGYIWVLNNISWYFVFLVPQLFWPCFLLFMPH